MISRIFLVLVLKQSALVELTHWSNKMNTLAFLFNGSAFQLICLLRILIVSVAYINAKEKPYCLMSQMGRFLSIFNRNIIRRFFKQNLCSPYYLLLSFYPIMLSVNRLKLQNEALLEILQAAVLAETCSNWKDHATLK